MYTVDCTTVTFQHRNRQLAFYVPYMNLVIYTDIHTDTKTQLKAQDIDTWTQTHTQAQAHKQAHSVNKLNKYKRYYGPGR